MEEKIIESDDSESADIICHDCKGNIVQVQQPKNSTKVFNEQLFVKWLYHCQTCGKQSKVFTSRISNNPTQKK